MNIRSIIGTLREASKLYAEKEAAKRLAQAKRDAAWAFNKVWTYHAPLLIDAKWMCPKCNSVHKATGEVTIWTGLQFPACCIYPSGHRLAKHHATNPKERPRHD